MPQKYWNKLFVVLSQENWFLFFCLMVYTNGSFSGTTRVSRYQKGKTNLDFTEARGSGISLVEMFNCIVQLKIQAVFGRIGNF